MNRARWIAALVVSALLAWNSGTAQGHDGHRHWWLGSHDENAHTPTAGEEPLKDAPDAGDLPPAPPLFDGDLPLAIEAVPEGLASISAQSCNACHFQAHDDWADSAHANTPRSEHWKEAMERAGQSTACSACHLPLVAQHDRLAAGYLDGDLSRPDFRDNPTWDPTLATEGVTCAACHVREGTIIGSNSGTDAPHPVTVSTELGSSEACAACHQLSWPGGEEPFYDTYGEWASSAYADAGVRCQDCHMPLQGGLATATRYQAQPSHGWNSSTARALTVQLELSEASIQRGQPLEVGLTVVNTGAGHAVPTGSPYKAYELRVVLVDAFDEPLTAPLTHRMAREVEDAPP
ncbi:MAG: multiheme c-type cytochrome, partial [Myxococcota bacterium]|nr:multiheme c-type cytochrome [Myxococcota bacterium]